MGENPLKALIIKINGKTDMGDIIEIAKAEASKFYRKPNKISVLDILHSRYGVIAVVQNLDGCNQSK